MWLVAALAALPGLSQAAPQAGYPREITITLEGNGQAQSTTPSTRSVADVRPPVEARPSGARRSLVVAQASQARSATSASLSRQQARLGVVTKNNTRIYRKASSRSQELFRCAKGTALGLVGQTKRYYAVMMIDRSLGFVDKARVELYDYGVAIDPQAAQATQRIVQIALEYMGVPYVWGGNTRGGIDCSGFVKAVFARLGVGLPRTAREQISVGREVRWGELSPGDRLYFSTHGTYVDHTGIYIGGGRFIHASGSHGGVVVSSITESKYYRTLVGARR